MATQNLTKSRNNNYKCACVERDNFSSTTKGANFFNGNTNQPTFLVTNVFLASSQIRTATNFSFSGATKVRFAKKNLNAFGKWYGSPMGSGSPPKNQF